MKQLTKGMYGTEFDPKNSLFGLSTGQMHGENQVVHNGGWYNKEGEKLGWGDLSEDDFKRITEEIREDELFIVLPEKDSFWGFSDNVKTMSPDEQIRSDINNPGKAYIAKYCSYVIGKTIIYLVDEFYYSQYGNSKIEREGLNLQLLNHGQAKKMFFG